MRKLVITFLVSGVSILSANAQALFTYGPHSVTKEEFLRVYKKNSMNKAPDMSDTALRSYLELYSLFRMKVAEADKQSLDTVQKIQNDLNNYRKQLAKNYLTDEQVTNKMIKEAYERMKENVRVQHILITCTPGSDTVAAYKRIDSFYQLVNSGKAKFDTLAKQFSDDRGTREIGGDLGYFTALQTVYQFENVAYSTPVGKVSKPFRTQFGYHILKVTDKRADRGTLKVAQILIMSPKSKGDEGIAAARKRADSVKTMLKNGVPFHELVSKYSEDKFTINDSGIMKPFSVGKMTPAFENAAYALKKPGDVSDPVKTEYGFHIIKLISKTPLAPYDTLYSQLKRKVENDSRAQNAKEQYFNKIKEKNGFKEYTENVNAIVDAVVKGVQDTGKMRGMFRSADFSSMNKTVFTLAGKNYLQSDFTKFAENLTRGRVTGPKLGVIKDAYNNYVTSVVTDFQEHKLVEENPEFKNLMNEYRDGIMLFELMDRNVWGKATKDSAGLKAFHETRKNKYMWEPGFEGSVYTFKDKAALDTGMLMLKETVVIDENIMKALNSQNNPDRVTIQRGRYEFSRYRDATQAELTNNRTKVINLPNGSYKVIVAKQIFTTPGVKSLDEARGYVVAEYQDYLEKQWNERMRKEYPVRVNDKVLQSISK